MIGPDETAMIRRLYFGEHWKVGTIVAQHGYHPDTVKRAINHGAFAGKGRCVPSKLDPYLDFIEQTLKEYPRLRATRIQEMIVDRGYTGQITQTRNAVARLRPAAIKEAYLRLKTLPGEQAQVDWGSFGKVRIGKAERSLSAFVMVLSWSRAMHALFTLDQQHHSFLRGHVEAFEYFGGVPRVCLYDNLKTVVLQRLGDSTRFNPKFLKFCGHYHFEPRPVAVARGNEKGRVERAIRFLRERFFAARSFADVDDLNRQFREWRERWAHERPCPGDTDITVKEAFAQERQVLMALPEQPYNTDIVEVLRSGKTPYIRFDRNDYSIPYELVRKPLTLVVSESQVRILDDNREVACHPRSFSKKETIEDDKHISALVEAKHSARQSRAMTRLFDVVPTAKDFLERVLERGHDLAKATKQLEGMLDDYGATELITAVDSALERGTFATSSIAHLLDLERRKQNLKPLVPLSLPDDPRVREMRIAPHNLENYDGLSKNDND